MKFLTERADADYIVEKTDEGKKYFIEGIFMQSDVKNRNGRIYPHDVLIKEVLNYQKLIDEKRSTGELGHPSSPSINLHLISHLITELSVDGNNIIGRAKILDTPMGKITKSLIDEDVKLGVSSRGLGTIKESHNGKIVQSFMLTTVDIVAEPSAPDAFVENLIENIEWVFDGSEWQKIEQKKTMLEDFQNKNRAKREAEFMKFIKALAN